MPSREKATSVNIMGNSFVSDVFALCSTSDRNIWFEANRYYFRLSIIFQLLLGKACYTSPPITLTFSSIHLYLLLFQISNAAATICLLLPAGGKLFSAQNDIIPYLAEKHALEAEERAEPLQQTRFRRLSHIIVSETIL